MSDKCKTMIHGDWGRYHQCRNSAKREGYCGMHHPDAVKARQEKSTKLYEENREKSDSYRLKKALATIDTLTEQVRAQDKWISVDVELPKDGEYLCLVDDIITSWQEVLAYKSKTKTWHSNYVNGAFPPRVTAYQPLPTPPKEAE